MPREDFLNLSVAILLRGIHYKENYTCQWTGKDHWKPLQDRRPELAAYTVDFEHIFAESFQEAILNNLNTYDIFACTYPSPKKEPFLERYKPVDSLFIGEDDRFGYEHTQCRGFQAGLEMIKAYAKKHNKKYDMVMCTRSDIGYRENFLDHVPLDEERMLAYYQWKVIKEWLSQGACSDWTMRGCHDSVHLFPYKIISDVICAADQHANMPGHQESLHCLPALLDKSLVHYISHPDDHMWDGDGGLWVDRG